MPADNRTETRPSPRNPSAPRFAVIIPVFNHAAKVADVLGRAAALGFPVFVIDDGSTDATAEELKRLAGENRGITLLRHPENLGKGAALLTGMRAAAAAADFAVTIDGDGQHDPAQAADLVRAIPEGDRPLVVGCRAGMLSDRRIHWTRRFGRKFSNFWVRVSGGPRVSDSQSGFRIYPLPETLALPARGRRYDFEVEVLVLAHRRGIPVREVPISVHYPKRAAYVTHFRPFVDFCRNGIVFTRLIASRILSLFTLK
ncbi:MAG: glycosyltransferase family 2 protein [bacterium]|nr:glycosyltransferase family 2 protein [bacterium]